MGLLETHVKAINAEKIAHNINPRFRWWGNYDYCDDGRVWILWNDSLVDVTIISASAQHAHCKVFLKRTKEFIYLTFVYAYNLGVHRRSLWDDLVLSSHLITSPWLCLGDFNSILYSSE